MSYTLPNSTQIERALNEMENNRVLQEQKVYGSHVRRRDFIALHCASSAPTTMVAYEDSADG